MPPSWAMAMASGASVTVSMAADTIGTFSAMLRVRRRADVDLRGQHLGLLRHQQDVVEGQRFGQLVRQASHAPRRQFVPWHFLYFLPLPQGQGSLRPTFLPSRLTVCTVVAAALRLLRLGLGEGADERLAWGR